MPPVCAGFSHDSHAKRADCPESVQISICIGHPENIDALCVPVKQAADFLCRYFQGKGAIDAEFRNLRWSALDLVPGR